jgi:membrane associated rhomboid family serine protease
MARKYDPQLDKLLREAEEGDTEALKKIKKRYPGLDKQLSESDEEGGHHLTQRVSIVQEWLELDTAKVTRYGQVWRLLTHAFCHDRAGIWHILFNMLCLYWFGCTLESMYGSREFALFYLTAAVVAALGYVGVELQTGSSMPAVGASGAVMAVMMLYTMHYPRQIIYICWVIPIEMRWLMALYVVWDLHPVLLVLAGDQVMTGIGHAAHLGGLAFGFLYFKFQWRLETLTWRLHWPRRARRSQPRLRLVAESFDDAEPDREMEQLDQLLQKISASGQASLTDDERALLQKASERIRGRGPGR